MRIDQECIKCGLDLVDPGGYKFQMCDYCLKVGLGYTMAREVTEEFIRKHLELIKGLRRQIELNTEIGSDETFPEVE